ncbi:MAG: hypothetical protein K6A36_01160 [Paludibacteraceae bacterium]|nr:hypothetical protein [Paludibacteraceae bacterium]
MNKIFRLALCAVCVMGMAACNENKTNVTTKKESELQRTMQPYVQNTVVATYSAMADEGMVLLDKCEKILAAQEAGKDYSALMAEAGTAWRAMRKYWEQSEAFLYGPAAAHNIDPHIDSWPLDFNAMNALLNDAAKMAELEEEGGSYVGDKLGYALKGFHAAEYLLFESEIKDGRAVGTGRTHAANLTHAEAVYLLGIVEDLTQQAILLEDCWAGGVSAAKEAVIADGDESMSYGENYGDYMINAGKAGSLYKTYQEAAEEIIAGCVDIAGEVADLKMGNPYISSNDEERDYIESPYSCTSTIDFADNIRSIQHAYCGAVSGDYSISNYVHTQNAELDGKVRKAIEDAIAAIEAIQNFESTAKNNPTVKAAIEKVQELEEVLDEQVLPLLSEEYKE